MRLRVLLVAALLGPLPVATRAGAQAPHPAGAAARSALPADVVAFRTRREKCDHFRGEDADDEARAAEIARGAAKACTGTDAQLRQLKRRYAGNARIKALLAPYGSQIE